MLQRNRMHGMNFIKLFTQFKLSNKTIDLILPYTDVYTRCFPSVCGKKPAQATRAGFEPTTSCSLVQTS